MTSGIGGAAQVAKSGGGGSGGAKIAAPLAHRQHGVRVRLLPQPEAPDLVVILAAAPQPVQHAGGVLGLPFRTSTPTTGCPDEAQQDRRQRP